MSFEQLSVAELKETMEYFGVESEKNTGKENFIYALEQDGITWDQYIGWKARTEEPVDEADLPIAPSKKPKQEPQGETVLVKMERANPRYDSYGHTFTKSHPYVLMSADDAQEIFDHEKGFRPATPREAQEFYS